MNTRDLNTLDKLLERTNNLPEILHLRAVPFEYEKTEEDKKLLFDTYEKLDDILKEVAAFINVKFPGRQSFIYAWNAIDFDTKIGDFKVVTTDREHIKRAWKSGISDLKDLIKTLRNEVVLLIEENEELNSSLSDNNARTNSFSGNIIYNESKVVGNQSQSSSSFSQNMTKQAAKDETKIIKNIFIGLFVTIVGGLILWYLTTNVL